MRVGILGGGESGVGAALLAKSLKYKVFVSDTGEIKPGYRQELRNYNIPFEERGHSFDILEQSDIVVKSPGIPGNVEIIRHVADLGAEVISEIEFAYRHCPGKVVGITGSNGKTTTAMLIHHLAEAGGVANILCGNIGASFTRAVLKPAEWYVVEISSFQLDDVARFTAEIAILLNITPDHLDRYGGSLERYAQAKFRLVRNDPGCLIYNSRDEMLADRFAAVPWAVAANEHLTDNAEMGELLGQHNRINAACALEAIDRMGANMAYALDALRTFKKPPHRMELVATKHNVRYINDSKATNVEAAYSALEAVEPSVIWIAGGQDKGNDYDILKRLAREKVKALICLGVNNTPLLRAFDDLIPIVHETDRIEEAVRQAHVLAQSGDTVLLSPACASFDLFKNYEERGDLFRDAVRNEIDR